MTGLQRSGRRYRFLTLTLGPEFTPAEFQHAWRILKERLRRRGLLKDYIRVLERGPRNGSLHAHLIITGRYIDRMLLVHHWQQLTGQWNVDIRDGTAPQFKLASELAGYMAKDPSARLAYSWGWAWPGLAATWSWYLKCARMSHQLERVGFGELLENWARCARAGIPPPEDVKSCRLIGFFLPWVGSMLPLPPGGYREGYLWSSSSAKTRWTLPAPSPTGA